MIPRVCLWASAFKPERNAGEAKERGRWPQCEGGTLGAPGLATLLPPAETVFCLPTAGGGELGTLRWEGRF